jgi:hypothetical protein
MDLNEVHSKLTCISIPSRTPIDLTFKKKLGKHVRRLHVIFPLNSTIGLRIMTVAAKLDRCTFYVKIRI